MVRGVPAITPAELTLTPGGSAPSYSVTTVPVPPTVIAYEYGTPTVPSGGVPLIVGGSGTHAATRLRGSVTGSEKSHSAPVPAPTRHPSKT